MKIRIDLMHMLRPIVKTTNDTEYLREVALALINEIETSKSISLPNVTLTRICASYLRKETTV